MGVGSLSQEHKILAISPKRCKIWTYTVTDGLIGSRTTHRPMRFRLVPKSMTLDDLKRRIQGLPKVFKYNPLLSQEGVKLRTSTLAGRTLTHFISQGPSEQNGQNQLKVLEKRERGRNQGLPNVLKYPLLSQERVKLWTSNLAGTFTVSIRINKSPFKISEQRGRGRIQGLHAKF